MADDWEKLLDDFDQAIGQNQPAKIPSAPKQDTAAPQSTVNSAKQSLRTPNFSTERRQSTDDLFKLVATAPKQPQAPEPQSLSLGTPQQTSAKTAEVPAQPPSLSKLFEQPGTPKTRPVEAVAATGAGSGPTASLSGDALASVAVAVDVAVAGLERRMGETIREELSLVLDSVDSRLARSEDAVTRLEKEIGREISDSQGRVLESVTSVSGEMVGQVLKEMKQMKSDMENSRQSTDRLMAAMSEQVQIMFSAFKEQLDKRDKEDSVRLAKEKQTMINYKSEITDLLQNAQVRVENARAILHDAKHELKRQLEIAEDERRRAAMETENVSRMRREVEAEKKALALDRLAVEEQARRVAEKAQEIAEAWKKAGEARDEVMQLCSEVDREKEALIEEGRRLDDLREWIEGEKEQVLQKVANSKAAKPDFSLSKSFASQPQPLQLQLAHSGTFGGSQAPASGLSVSADKWSKLRQDAESFHKMVSSLTLPSSRRAGALGNN